MEATTYKEVTIRVNGVAWKVPQAVAKHIAQLEAKNERYDKRCQLLEGTRKTLELDTERLVGEIERIKERAERVKEGEDWDLAGYCIEVIGKALGGD